MKALADNESAYGSRQDVVMTVILYAICCWICNQCSCLRLRNFVALTERGA